MFEALRRLLHPPQHELEEVPAPTAVEIVSRVASPNVVKNPISGSLAAVFRVDFLVKPPPSREPNPAPIFVGSIVVGGDLVLDVAGHRILLPRQRYRLDFVGASGMGVRLDVELPPGCEHIEKAPGRGQRPLFYRELSLSQGEEVELIATVDRVHAVGYRDQPADVDAPLVARPDLAPVVVRYTLPSFA